MFFCNDKGEDEERSVSEWKIGFKEEMKSEPIKFQLLTMLGLKEYIIDKYIFSRHEPKYEIVEEEGRKAFKTDQIITIPEGYRYEIDIIEQDNHSIPTILLKMENRDQYNATLIYSHGNSSDLSNSFAFITKFAAKFPFLDFIVYDYTGYGKSNLKNITQESICQDLQIIIQHYKIPNEQIILWGFSLGTYPTSKIASRRQNLKGVVLQSPLASIYSLFDDNLSPYKMIKNDCFNLLQHISNINTILLFVHSKDDEIIPFEHSKLLFQKYKLTNSNPLCFMSEVTVLKHNHMHSLICDINDNVVNEQILYYLNLMIKRQELSKSKMLQLSKSKYFQNLGDIQSSKHIDIEDKEVNETTKDMYHEKNEDRLFPQSMNFTQVKQEHMFEMDDVQNQEYVDFNYYMEVKTEKHKKYFSQSAEAKDQTEHSCILEQEIIISQPFI